MQLSTGGGAARKDKEKQTVSTSSSSLSSFPPFSPTLLTFSPLFAHFPLLFLPLHHALQRETSLMLLIDCWVEGGVGGGCDWPWRGERGWREGAAPPWAHFYGAPRWQLHTVCFGPNSLTLTDPLCQGREQSYVFE